MGQPLGSTRRPGAQRGFDLPVFHTTSIAGRISFYVAQAFLPAVPPTFSRLRVKRSAALKSATTRRMKFCETAGSKACATASLRNNFLFGAHGLISFRQKSES